MPTDILEDWTYLRDIRLRDRLRCVYCGLDGRTNPDVFRQFVTDHLVPRSAPDAPADGPENLVTACYSCNTSKGAFDPRDHDETGVPLPTSRARMIRNAKRRVQYNRHYYLKCHKAFLSRSAEQGYGQ